MSSYRDLTGLRRPAADHSGLPTTILPVIGRKTPKPEPKPAGRPSGYTGQHRGGTR